MFAMNYQTLKINEILTHEIIGRSLKKYGKWIKLSTKWDVINAICEIFNIEKNGSRK
jgi:hypothetical protein